MERNLQRTQFTLLVDNIFIQRLAIFFPYVRFVEKLMLISNSQKIATNTRSPN